MSRASRVFEALRDDYETGRSMTFYLVFPFGFPFLEVAHVYRDFHDRRLVRELITMLDKVGLRQYGERIVHFRIWYIDDFGPADPAIYLKDRTSAFRAMRECTDASIAFARENPRVASALRQYHKLTRDYSSDLCECHGTHEKFDVTSMTQTRVNYETGTTQEETDSVDLIPERWFSITPESSS